MQLILQKRWWCALLLFRTVPNIRVFYIESVLLRAKAVCFLFITTPAFNIINYLCCLYRKNIVFDVSVINEFRIVVEWEIAKEQTCSEKFGPSTTLTKKKSNITQPRIESLSLLGSRRIIVYLFLLLLPPSAGTYVVRYVSVLLLRILNKHL
jgi:hypothetical protein